MSVHPWEPASHRYSKFREGLTRRAAGDLRLPLSSLWFYEESTASRTSLKCLKTGLLSSSCFCGGLVFTWGGNFSLGSGRSEVTGKPAHWHT